MTRKAKVFLLVVCVVALMTFLCPRRVNSRKLTAAEAKNHIGEAATACGKVTSTNSSRRGRSQPSSLGYLREAGVWLRWVTFRRSQNGASQ